MDKSSAFQFIFHQNITTGLHWIPRIKLSICITNIIFSRGLQQGLFCLYNGSESKHQLGTMAGITEEITARKSIPGSLWQIKSVSWDHKQSSSQHHVTSQCLNSELLNSTQHVVHVSHC